MCFVRCILGVLRYLLVFVGWIGRDGVGNFFCIEWCGERDGYGGREVVWWFWKGNKWCNWCFIRYLESKGYLGGKEESFFERKRRIWEGEIESVRVIEECVWSWRKGECFLYWGLKKRR